MSEITLLLHPVTARKLREEIATHSLSYDQVLERLFEHEQFNRLSEQLAAIPSNYYMYFPSTAIGVDVTFDTEFYAQSPRCAELLTSFAIASCHCANLWQLLLATDIEAALRYSGLEFRLIRRVGNYQQTISFARQN